MIPTLEERFWLGSSTSEPDVVATKQNAATTFPCNHEQENLLIYRVHSNSGRQRFVANDIDIQIAIDQALFHGTKFIVSEDGVIQVRNPERMPLDVRDLLRSRWLDASTEILKRDTLVRNGKPQQCVGCGSEIARWIGGNLWVPGYLCGWGEHGWANMGQAISEVRCRVCGTGWRAEHKASWDPRL